MITTTSPSSSRLWLKCEVSTTRSFTATAIPGPSSFKFCSNSVTVAPLGSSRRSPLTVAVTLHPGVDGAFAALRRDPRDDLIRVHDIAGLTVDAVAEIDLQPAI